LHRRALPWNKVTVTLTDERWVPPTHNDSNEALVWRYLLKDAAAVARFVPLYGGEATPQAGQAACENRLKTLNLPFDAVYLGMGEDGHFASLFPGDEQVNVTDGLCVAVPQKGSRLPRMSLTAPAVLNARHIYLLFSGAAKYAQYQKALLKGDPNELPLRLVLQQTETPVTVLYVP
jgi:6-phosphogluconolactonase